MNFYIDKVLTFVTISILFIFTVLGKGFANINIAGLPFFQLILLLLSLIVIFLKRDFFSKIFNSHFWFFLQLFILFNLGILFYSFFENRLLIRIIQDAEVIYDIIFVFLSVYVSSKLNLNQHKKIFTYVFLSMFFYYFLIIVIGKNTMQFFSPKIGGVYSSVPAFGFLPSHTILACGAIFFWNNLSSTKKSLDLFFGSIISIAALISQKRFVLIQAIILLIFYFKSINIKSLKKMLNFSLILLISFALFNIFNINMSKGSEASFGNIYKTLESTFVENEFSGGVSFRKNILTDFQKMINTPKEVLIGVGFGVPLTERIGGDGKTNRTPHIFLLTVIGRIGLIGLTFIMSFLIYFLFLGIKSYFYEDDTETKIIKYFLIVSLIIYFVEAQINPTLEYAHTAFFRYYTLGCLIGINLKN